MLCFWGMQRLFCSLIYHSQDLPILFLTKENYDSSCHRQTSHVSFLSSQVSHKLYLIIELHELLRNGTKESGNREQHWILFLCEVRDPWKVRDSKALSLSWVVCFHTLLCNDACHTPFRPAPVFSPHPKSPLGWLSSGYPQSEFTGSWHWQPA